MIINTFSYLWSLPAVDAISELVRSGYSVFEVPVSSPHCWPDEMSPTMRSDSKKLLQDYAASIRSLNAGGYDINLASPGANMRRKSIDHIKDVIDLAVDWDVVDVVISPGTRRPMISPPIPQTGTGFGTCAIACTPSLDQTRTLRLHRCRKGGACAPS